MAVDAYHEKRVIILMADNESKNNIFDEKNMLHETNAAR